MDAQLSFIMANQAQVRAHCALYPPPPPPPLAWAPLLNNARTKVKVANAQDQGESG